MDRGKALLKKLGILGVFALSLGFALAGAAAPAAAQTYVCPAGYYFLANYGCYPFGGYSYYAPPPAYYYYPPTYPYYAPFGVAGGFRFGFGDHDHDRFGHDGFHGGSGHGHR